MRHHKPNIEWDLTYLKEGLQNQSSIQFWFKFGDKSYYEPRDISAYSEVTIFEMINGANQKPFWSVFLRDYYVSQDEQYVMFRELVVSPFGNARD